MTNCCPKKIMISDSFYSKQILILNQGKTQLKNKNDTKINTGKSFFYVRHATHEQNRKYSGKLSK